MNNNNINLSIGRLAEGRFLISINKTMENEGQFTQYFPRTGTEEVCNLERQTGRCSIFKMFTEKANQEQQERDRRSAATTSTTFLIIHTTLLLIQETFLSLSID